MHHYSEAASLILEAGKESKILALCIRGIVRCSQYTDFGPHFQESEVSEWKADLEFYAETGKNFHDSTICRLIQNAFADLMASTSIESIIPNLLSLSSNHRLFVQSTLGLYELPRFFRWVVPFRLAIMGTPASAKDIIVLRDRLRISTIVTLTEEQSLPEEWFEDGLSRNVYIPVRDFCAPEPEQIDKFIEVVISLPRDEAVLVHCGAGKGRAGTFVACYLMACGFQVKPSESNPDQYLYMFPAETIRLIRHMRPGSIESVEQENFIRGFGDRLLRSAYTGPSAKIAPIEEPTHPLEVVVGTLRPDPSLIVCCGLQRSGKSTFAAQLAAHLGFTVVSQDTLGTRSACLAALANAVQGGKRVVVDLCNPKPEDREDWLACAFNPDDAICAWFDVDRDVCIYRANSRTDHQTIAQARAKRIIMSLSKTFVQPTPLERFACFARIRSIRAADEMLHKLGVPCREADSTSKVSTKSAKSTITAPLPLQPPTISGPVFHKFPRTRHLINTGAATNDDIVLQDTDINAFLETLDRETTLTLEEKVDGANMGFTLDPSTYTGFRAQSRGRFLEPSARGGGATDKQFQKVDRWILQHSNGLRTLLLGPNKDAPPGKYVLYGEWLLARHSIHYTKLPNLFLVFDLYDAEEDSFLSRRELGHRLEGTRILQVPALPIPDVVDGQTLLDLVATQQSKYYDGVVEGIYFRRERDGKTIDRAKMVRSDFTAGNPNFERGFIENVVV